MNEYASTTFASVPASPPENYVSGQDAQFWLRNGQWLGVRSSWVNAIRYLWEMKSLEIEFHGAKDGVRRAFRYYGVAAELALQLLKSPSKGKWVHEHIVRQHWQYFSTWQSDT